jgi:hypothetical protein
MIYVHSCLHVPYKEGYDQVFVIVTNVHVGFYIDNKSTDLADVAYW